MQRTIILANGELPDLSLARLLLHADDYVICADGGIHYALALDLIPDLIIGDLDSADEEALQKFKDQDVKVESFPRDKNETDLELAIQRAMERNPTQIVIVAGLGGRLDQTLANITLLTDLRLSAVQVRLDDGLEEIFLCRDRAEIRGRSGDTVSLIPWQGAVSEVQTTNLKWALRKEILYPDKTRGISNEMTEDMASVVIGAGLLLIVRRRLS